MPSGKIIVRHSRPRNIMIPQSSRTVFDCSPDSLKSLGHKYESEGSNQLMISDNEENKIIDRQNILLLENPISPIS